MCFSMADQIASATVLPVVYPGWFSIGAGSGYLHGACDIGKSQEVEQVGEFC